MGSRIALAPDVVRYATKGSAAVAEDRRRRLEKVVVEAGGTVVSPDAAEGLIWLDLGDATPLAELLDANPAISWVQLPWAGVESFPKEKFSHRDVRFTCAKASYGEQVGEHALLLSLICLRNVVEQARRPSWHPRQPESLFRKRVTILGAGGIANTLIELLRPFDCYIRVVRRTSSPVPGANRTLALADLSDVLPTTDVLVAALALTPETRHVIGARELAALPNDAVVVNVARGAIIDTDALVAALNAGEVAAAGLDVTDPEPLEDGHPLWGMDNVFISSHCADSLEFVTQKLAERVQDNLRRFGRGEELVGQVDWAEGY